MPPLQFAKGAYYLSEPGQRYEAKWQVPGDKNRDAGMDI